MNVSVRKASVEDASIVAVLFNAYRVWYHQPSDIVTANYFVAERLRNNESVIFLAYINDQAIGFTQLYPIFTSVGMQRAYLLNDLFVDASARGNGVATALLNAAKAFAKAHSSKWLMLQTSHDNYAAQALYEKDGWEKERDLLYMYHL